jgi:predicted MPP superfamily phosphohydrolase
LSQSHNLPRRVRLYKFMEARTRFAIALISAFALVSARAVAQNVNANGNDNGHDQVSVIQISDTHLGDKHAPHAAENLRQAVGMINDRHPDAVILSGDIGENPQAWDEAKSILKKLKSPLYYVPGNHDVHSKDVGRYRKAFGKDYYEFQVKYVNFVVIDSQLLGNYDTYEAKAPVPLTAETEDEAGRMLSWLNGLQEELHTAKHIAIGVQHIPIFNDGRFPDPKPYWVINEPYRSQEMKVLRQLGIKHMLVGHWHNGRIFEREGITWHEAPATSWLPWGGELGFAVHTISPNGNVQTEFVALPAAVP